MIVSCETLGSTAEATEFCTRCNFFGVIGSQYVNGQAIVVLATSSLSPHVTQ